MLAIALHEIAVACIALKGALVGTKIDEPNACSAMQLEQQESTNAVFLCAYFSFKAYDGYGNEEPTQDIYV